MQRRLGLLRNVPALVAVLVVAAGCQTFAPVPLDEVGYQERIQTKEDDDITVRVAVLSPDEAKQAFGTDLAKQGIQPVWLEVQNHSDTFVWLMPVALDPDYYSPMEAAYYGQSGFSAEDKKAINTHFDRLRFGSNVVEAGRSRSGFIFTNLDEGVKLVNVDLVGLDELREFSFIVDVPGLKTQTDKIDFDTLYAPEELILCDDLDALRRELEQLPPTTTNKDGTEEGDPITFFLVGTREDLVGPLVKRNWHPTETIHGGSIGRSIDAFITHSKYRYMPISPLYYFGRPQDTAAQKIRTTVHERNHLRAWMTPIRYRGKEVWAGTISRDIGVKMTTKSWNLMTHRIDGDLNEARTFLGQDLAYAHGIEAYGVVRGGYVSTLENPRMNLTGDPYLTDGYRTVLFIAENEVAPNDIVFLDWETPGSLEEAVEEQGAVVEP